MMFRRGDHVGPPLRLMVLFIMVCTGGFPTHTVLYCFLSYFVWATWERPFNIASMFTGLHKPPVHPNHVIHSERTDCGPGLLARFDRAEHLCITVNVDTNLLGRTRMVSQHWWLRQARIPKPRPSSYPSPFPLNFTFL